MRNLMILVLTFCSAISGWTPVLAQIQHRVRPQIEMAAPHQHGAANPAGCDHDEKRDGCGHAVHPMLCAACFAVQATGPTLFERTGLALMQASWLQNAMEDKAVEPVHPPPKA